VDTATLAPTHRKAEGPEASPAEATRLVRGLLERIASALESPRPVLAWEESEEPWINVACLDNGKLDWRREDSEAVSPLASPHLAEVSFISQRGEEGEGGFRVELGSGPETTHQDPLPSWLGERFREPVVLSAPWRGQSSSGRLFALRDVPMTLAELAVGRALAREAGESLDWLTWFDRRYREGLAEERLRISQDLHDGVIQSLAAAALQLEAVRQLVRQDPASAERLLEGVQELLLFEQRELRNIASVLESGAGGAAGEEASFIDRLRALSQQVQSHWHLEVELASSIDRIESSLGYQVQLILREALANAARHGRASRASVELVGGEAGLHLSITDNGRGFPFQGRYDLATLSSEKLGPVSLKRRVSALGGRPEILSSAAGARLEITVPWAESGGL
jgi:signal transduction histidine kinase